MLTVLDNIEDGDSLIDSLIDNRKADLRYS